MNKKPLIALIGFWARGNIGDEAILNSIILNLRSDFEFLIVLDEYGAAKGYWDHYPYNSYPRTHIGNTQIVGHSVAGLLVGGGGLGTGYGAAQACVVRSRNRPVALVGVDGFLKRLKPNHPIHYYYDIFNYISVRTKRSFEFLNSSCIDCHYGADWVLSLTRNRLVRPRTSFGHTIGQYFNCKKTLIITVREFDLSDQVLVEKLDCIIKLIAGLKCNKILLPFCPEDERLIREFPSLAQSVDKVIVPDYFNVSSLTNIFRGADAVLSFGRLHPLVFARIHELPAIGFDIDRSISEIGFTKVSAMSEELGYRCYPYCQLEKVTAHDIESELFDTTFNLDDSYQDRLTKQVNDIKILFKNC